MTIRFLKPWNGYQPDAVVTGLTNEATLIAGGLASADLDGGNDGRTYEAKLSTDASGNTGLVGPDGRPCAIAQPVRKAIRIVDGRLEAPHTIVHAAGPGKTFHAVFRLAAPPDRVWVISMATNLPRFI